MKHTYWIKIREKGENTREYYINREKVDETLWTRSILEEQKQELQKEKTAADALAEWTEFNKGEKDEPTNN
jgi:hypothetical protein